MKFGKTLKTHIQESKADPSWYVDYALLKAACSQRVTETDFRRLYLEEAMKFLGHMREGQLRDPLYVEMNLAALEKACKKFDKISGLGKPERMEVGIQSGSCPQRFQVRLQRHLESMGVSIELQISTTRERCEKLFEELGGGQDGETLLDEEALMRGLKQMCLPCSRQNARELIDAADADGDGKISFRDFKSYVFDRERAIRETFNTLDKSDAGNLNPGDLLRAINLLGIDATKNDVEELIKRTNELIGPEKDEDADERDHTTTNKNNIDYHTFRQLLVLLPSSDTREVFQYWQQAVDIDFASIDETPRGANQRFLETFIAGGIAGAVSRTCTAPLDRLKLLLQTDTAGKYTGIVSGLREIYEEGKQHRLSGSRSKTTRATGWRGILGGLMAFFRGNGTNVVKIAPETAIKFWAYESAKLSVCTRPEKPSGIERFVCGAIGGATAQSAIYPLEIVKTRLAVSKPGTYKGITHCLFKISRKEGFGALYKGLTASVLGIIPYSGVDMAVYFSLRERYRKHTTSPGGMMLCGAVSSTCGMVCSFPLQLIRTRLQAGGLEGMAKYDGVLDCFTKTVRKDGFLGLYRGFGPNMLKALPAISITYTVYENVKRRLIDMRD
uniref:EF-hand domain-containing protein n=1 Tax=Lotharella globosa TaxID=91324 RepID=A0A7S4DNY2_9EUKA|mmetsp:Transcript_4626/g.9017  ORF Transcript_4626/g.9017 Transcript_4626/m.9017 type:complete len:614 (-) Transcript_4626:298-2139(-)